MHSLIFRNRGYFRENFSSEMNPTDRKKTKTNQKKKKRVWRDQFRTVSRIGIGFFSCIAKYSQCDRYPLTWDHRHVFPYDFMILRPAQNDPLHKFVKMFFEKFKKEFHEYISPFIIHFEEIKLPHDAYVYLSRGVMVNAVDCGIVVREFVLQSRYYVHFRANTLGKGMNPLILPAMG